MKRLMTAVAVLFGALCAAAAVPHWISILPLPPSPDGRLADDVVFMGEKTITDGVAWICSLVPEGDPAMDKASVYLRRYREVAARLNGRTDLPQGVLIQSSIGHGWTPGMATPWRKIVRYDGTSSYRFCPLGEKFRAHIAGQARTLAAARPDFFMVDDDAKLLGKIDGCFCPQHLAAFSRRCGKVWTREALLSRLQAGDDPVRTAWTAFTDASFLDFLRLIRAAFPPEIPGSLCAVDGSAAWLKLAGEGAAVLAGPGVRPVLRVGSAPYWTDGLYDILSVRRSMARQLMCVGPAVDVIAEGDTCPQLRWQTSATRALDHLTVLTAEGSRGAKMWWHRTQNVHERRSSSAYLNALSGRSGFLRRLASDGFEQDGVWCPANEGKTDWGVNVFGRLGIPCRYGRRRPGDVAALTGPSTETLDAATLTNILSGPVVLDGSAAIALAARGFAALTGVRAVPWTGKKISFEDFGDRRLSGATGTGPADLRDRAPGAAEVSRLFNRVSALASEETYLAPGSVRFENGRGGRVLTLAATVPAEPLLLWDYGYCNETRKTWLVGELARLAGTFPGGVYYPGDESLLCLSGRTSRGERVVLLDSLDLDPVERPRLFFADAPRSVERLSDDGTWAALPFTRAEDGLLVFETVLRPHRPLVLRCLP